MRSSSVFTSLLAALPTTYAWGATGHETVAYIAQSFLTSEAQAWAQKILGDTSDSYLANVATWADTYRYTSAGHWSAPLHFIDAQDSPPHSCGVDFDRDCGAGGCVVSAITNYTTQVQSSSDDQATALKFIVHFIGDVHQPLHCEKLDVGGNTIDVTYGSAKTNLHATWDTYMIGADAGKDSLATAQSFATKLETAIKSGAYQSQAAGWITNISIKDGETQASAMTWATDANSFVCTIVMPNGPDVLSGTDLSGDYYTSAISTVELQLAKAGYRLAAWLNALAGTPTGGSAGSGGPTVAPSTVPTAFPTTTPPPTTAAPPAPTTKKSSSKKKKSSTKKSKKSTVVEVPVTTADSSDGYSDGYGDDDGDDYDDDDLDFIFVEV